MCCQAHLLPALSGSNAPSSTGGVTPLRLPALTLRGSLHIVQDGSAFFPRAFGLVRRVVLFSNGRVGRPQRTYVDQVGIRGRWLCTPLPQTRCSCLITGRPRACQYPVTQHNRQPRSAQGATCPVVATACCPQ